jgi:hypothetical protein
MDPTTANARPFVRPENDTEGSPAVDHTLEHPDRIGPAFSDSGQRPHPVRHVLGQGAKDASVS